MQIVKGDGNSQLRKDEEIYLRKINPQRSTARNLKTILSPVVPFDGVELWGIPRPVDTMGVPAGSHATPSQKKRLGKRVRPRTRCQGSAREQNTNDDGDDIRHLFKNSSSHFLKFYYFISFLFLLSTLYRASCHCGTRASISQKFQKYKFCLYY